MSNRAPFPLFRDFYRQSKEWLKGKEGGAYLNWDITQDRSAIRKIFQTGQSPANHLALDEIHKYSRWKQNVKGLYDGLFPRLKTVITGSARLDVYQRGGDSMLGRYHLLRLHPFSVGEVLRNFAEPLNGPPRSAADWLTLGQDRKDVDSQPTWERLLRRSGFAEPFLKDNDLYHQRWALRRKDLVLREDIRDISNIRTLDLVEELAELLPSRIGGPISINSLREDLQVAFDTVKAWIETLERLYYCYRIPPFSLRISRSLSKEQKLYLWDWSEIRSPAARFENAVASHLLKSVHFWLDLGFGDYDLLYWRNREKREIDFIITLGREPIVAIECKLSDSDLTDNFNPFSAKFPLVPRIQLVADPGIRKISENALVTTASRWLADLV